MNVRKRGLALLMCICMIFTLLPFSALADATAKDGDIVYGTYGTDGNWQKDNTLTAESSVKHYPAPGETSDNKANIYYSKTAAPVENEPNAYNVTLTIKSKTSETAPGASAVVLVIDNSNSMNYCATCNYDASAGGTTYVGAYHSKNCTKVNHTGWHYFANEVKYSDSRLKAAKDAAIDFARSYAATGTGRYLAIVAFHKDASIVNLDKNTFWLDVSNSDNLNKVEKAINRIDTGSGTNLSDGLDKALSALNNKTVSEISSNNKYTVLLTDGEPNYPENPATAAENSATNLKEKCKLYTVCVGAENTAFNNTTVGLFLKNKIASDPSYAYNTDSTEKLNKAFKDIFKSIEQGISSGFVVTDPMGKYVNLDSASLNGNGHSVSGSTITWEPKNGTTETNTDGSKTTTYTLTYKVTLGKVPNDGTYPLNENTTLKFKDGKNTDGSDNNVTLQFNVPGVKGKAPTYTVTYEYDGDVPEGAPPVPTDTNGYKAGDIVTVKPASTLDGYTFSGWTATGVVVDESGQFTMPGNEVVFKGTWVARNDLSYTVHHYWNGTTESVYDDEKVTGQTFNTTVPVSPKAANYNYTPVPTDINSVTITTGANVVTFYYYKNVTLTANSMTVTYNGEEQIVSGFTGAPEGADFSAIEVGAKGIQPNTYPANFAEGTKGTVDATGKYIVTDVVNGNLVIEAAYQVQYEYKNAPADAPACPTDDTYYADNTTVTLQQPGTAPTGYKFVGWKVDGTGDVVTEVTINGANVRLVGEWEPVTGLSYVVHYYWVGTEDKVAPDKTVDKQTFGTVITSETPIQVTNYKAVPDQVSNLTISTENEKNVITFYYYKNIELTANSGEAKYDGTLKTVDGFKAIVAADNDADIYESLKEELAAHGQGTDAGRYDVYFTKGGEIIPATDLVGRVLNDRYWVTKAEQGKLTISPRSLTITSGSDSKYYDGTPLTNDKITVTGDGFVNGEGATYKVTGSQTEVGSSKNTFDVIFKDNTKTTNYVVEKKLGDLTVNRRPMPPVNPPIMDEIIVEITGNSDSVVYDGTEHSVKGYTVKISDPRYTEKDFTFTGKAEASGVNAGTYEMGLKAEQFKNTNARFTNVKFVIKADGVLTITPKELTITAGSKTEYGPTPVTCDEWTVSGLVAGDKVESVKITGIQSVPGSSPNVPSDAVIKNAKGEDVTKNYAIKYVNGTLTMLEVLNKEDHFNYIIGTPEGLSLPTANVTRAEVATIFFRLMTDDARAKFDSLDNSFSDVAKGKWYNRAISTLANAGIIKGDPAGTYRPGDPITRAEMAAIIARFGDFKEGGKTFSDISGHWAQKYIELAASNGWINGNPDGTFKPNNNITRAETVAMINRVLDRQTKDVSDLLPVSQMTNWSDNMDTAKWYYRDMQEATNNHKAERVGNSIYEKWTEKLPDIDWASYQI